MGALIPIEEASAFPPIMHNVYRCIKSRLKNRTANPICFYGMEERTETTVRLVVGFEGERQLPSYRSLSRDVGQ